MKTLRIPALLVIALSAALATGCATAEDDTVTESNDTAEITARPKVEIWTDTAGKFHFHLLASNAAVLVTSQSYSSRTSALNGMLSVLSNGSTDAGYRVQPASGGGSYFNIVASNNAVIATSEVYSTEQAARGGVAATISAVDAYYEHWDNATGARFDVFQGQDLRFYFDLHAKNGAIILQSQGYSGQASALNGAFSVQENGVIAARYRVLQAVDGRWYFNLLAANGQVIATSQTYSSKANAERGRDAMIALLPQVQIL
jgi:uncharacterized protein YegP (UPF0339 family)